jgi:hypothetical protein
MPQEIHEMVHLLAEINLKVGQLNEIVNKIVLKGDYGKSDSRAIPDWQTLFRKDDEDLA